MSRTLQKILLVAAVASAPSVVLASPDQTTTKASQPSFFHRIIEMAKAHVKAKAPDQQTTHVTPPPSLPELPRWLKSFFDDHSRSTGT